MKRSNKDRPQVCPICGSPVQNHPRLDVYECISRREWHGVKHCGIIFLFHRLPTYEKLRDGFVSLE